MPNIKSAMKRDEKSKELRAKNRADKTALKTVMKKFDAAVAGGDQDRSGRQLQGRSQGRGQGSLQGSYP